MKIISRLSLLLIAAMTFASCEKMLDINTNPNTATSATPQIMLPQAITATASMVNTYNNMGNQLVGYMANAGGYGGFGSAVTYSFTASDFQGSWNFYDVLQDYQIIQEDAAKDPKLVYFGAIARIMKSHGFQMLVDTYNSIPYSEALKGQGNLTPKYDDPVEIYKSLADNLDSAMSQIRAGMTADVAPTAILSSQDPMFGGNMTNWLRFANTVKLRILVRGNGKVQFSNKTFDAAGFLTTDAMVDPGYERLNGKQNPKWNNWGFTFDGSDANKAWMPTTFIKAFYDGAKLSDPGRGAAIYYQWPSTPTNRLGNEAQSVVSSPSGSFWYPSTNRTGSQSGNATGVLKGPDAGMPIITAAESYFLQAEAVLQGNLTSTSSMKELFEAGIMASFDYLYQLPNGDHKGDFEADFEEYLEENDNSFLVNFDLATTPAQKLEAIITQKYIALNFVNADQAWNDYRRTGYPRLNNAAGAPNNSTFASLQSKSTRPDRLPTRIQYPSSEGAYNSANVPKGIDIFNSLIFWAQ